MVAYQICVRCGHRWPVSWQPRQWCPGCRGLLLSPDDTAAPVPPGRRNFRWVARPPQARSGQDGPRPRRRPAGPAPRYHEVPRWGLADPRPAGEPSTPSREETLADLAPTLLAGTAVVFGLAAVAEAVRYGLLLYNRTRLVDPLALAASDALVWATQLCGPAVALAAGVAATLRLIRVRRRLFAARGAADPRGRISLLLGCLVPGVNLAMPGVFLTEITGPDDPRLRRAVRTWWVLWALGGVLFVVNVLWRQRDTLQAQADGVLLAAVTAALAAAVAVAALHVVRLFDDEDLRGRPRRLPRRTVATGPKYEPIAPIEPVGARTDEAVAS
ncbi:DUF4328 domain-containing protein [Rhodococcus aetherivorans]